MTDTVQKTGDRRQQTGGRHTPSLLDVLLAPPASYFTLGGIVLAYYAIMNVLYFRQNGWLATHGSDIWYFLAVARGLQSISPLDITYWIVKPLAGAQPEQGFTILMCVAVYLHLLSSLLVYHFLGKLLRLDPLLRFVAALLFSTLPQNIVLSTASFTHFTVAQPLIILAFGLLFPWCSASASKPSVWGIICLAESMVIGPEGWFLAACLAIVAVSKRWDAAPLLQKMRCPPAVAVVVLCLAFALAFPMLYRIWGEFSLRFRGIDLIWQKQIRSGDLLPLGRNVVTIFAFIHCAWISTAIYALWKRRYLAAFFSLFFLTLAAVMLRGFYALELAGFASLMFLIGKGDLPRPWPTRILGGMTVWMLLLGLVPPKTSYVPPHFARVAQTIQEQAKPEMLIACSPTYGFFFQGWTGMRTTDDLHKPPGAWARLAVMRPLEAERAMKEQGIGFLIFTNYDYKPGSGGDWLSGGLDRTLQPLSDQDYRMSLIVRALTLEAPLVRPLRLISDQTDKVTGHRTLCLTPSS